MISVLRMRSRCVLLLLYAPRINYAIGGSALDWVRADIRVHYGAAFAAAVAGMRANTACAAEPRRYAAGHSRTEYTAFGSKLIVPPWARRVAEEHSPLLHFQAAAQLGWVGDRLQDIELPSDQKCAIEHTLYASAAARRLRSKTWFEWCESLRSYGKAIQAAHAPAHAAPITSDANPACLGAALDAINYRDSTLVELTVKGFPVTGCPIPDSGVYRYVETSQWRVAECNSMLRAMGQEGEAARWNVKVAAKTAKRAASDPEGKLAVIKATAKEVDKGIVQGPFSTIVKLRMWLASLTGKNLPVWPLYRFARWQPSRNAYRMIDDGKTAFTNLATVLLETIVCPLFDFALLVARQGWAHTQAARHNPPATTLALHDFS